MPRVSVLMSVHNDAPTLQEAVASIRAQAFTDWELILVNDGSTDGSWDLLQTLAAEEPRIVLITQAQQGLTAALNRALSIARGDYIARQDADDRSSSERLIRQVQLMDAHPEMVLVGTAYQNIDEDGSPLSISTVPSTDRALRVALNARNPLPHGSLLIRKSALDRAGGYRAPFLAAQDYDLLLRLAEIGTLHAIPEPLYILRLRRNSIGVSREKRQAYFAAKALDAAKARQLTGSDHAIVSTMISDFPDDSRPSFKYEYLKALHLVKSKRKSDARQVLRTVPWIAYAQRPAFIGLWLLSWNPGQTPRGTP